MKERLKSIGRAARMGKWRFVWMLTRQMMRGYLSTSCRTCGKPKERNAWTRCEQCQFNSLMAAIFAEDHNSDAPVTAADMEAK